MGEATKSSRGRTTRPPIASRRRGSTFYDRLEEARVRRQAVLADRKVAGSAFSLVKPAISRSKNGIVESTGNHPKDKISDGDSSEISNCSIVAIESDYDPLESLSGHETEEPFWESWRLIAPGIVLGLVFAIGAIGWINSPLGSATPVAEVNLPDPRNEASTAILSNPGPITVGDESPLVTAETTALNGLDPDADNYSSPEVTNWNSFVSGIPPAQVVPATVELPPLFDVMPPARHVGPPEVLIAPPPMRPKTAEPLATVVPEFPGLDIVLHVPNGVRQSDAQTLISAATEAGFEIAKSRPAAFSISRTNIRYFHEGDAVAAQLLASAIGGRLRDFTDFQPPPDPGVIEVWLQGRGSLPRGKQNTAERRGLFQDLRTELRRIFRPTGG